MEEYTPDETVQRWTHELDLSSKREQKWRKTADKIEKRFRHDGEMKKGKTFNILWANTETLRPALYSNTAKLIKST